MVPTPSAKAGPPTKRRAPLVYAVDERVLFMLTITSDASSGCRSATMPLHGWSVCGIVIARLLEYEDQKNIYPRARMLSDIDPRMVKHFRAAEAFKNVRRAFENRSAPYL